MYMLEKFRNFFGPNWIHELNLGPINFEFDSK